jgi:methylase of polypeptide subunit release factors
MEIAFDQGELAGQVMAEQPAFDEVRILKDYGGRDRVVTARRK